MSTSSTIAKLLLELGCVQLRPENPFQYTSGLYAPIYTDNRRIISFPTARNTLIDAFIATIAQQKIEFDVVAGTATAGIPHAAWISDRLQKPMVYVRSKPKGHGKQNQIEGALEKGQRALVIEDLISTGKSAMNAADALRVAGARVDDCLAIFSYQFSDAAVAFAQVNVSTHVLTGLDELLAQAQASGVIDRAARDQLQAWQANRTAWSAAMSP